MRTLIFTLCLALILPLFSSASDAELEEKLKAVMILFAKSQQGLKEEVASLELQVATLEENNEVLKKELDIERQINLELKTEALIRQSQALDTNQASDVIAKELVAANSEFADVNQPAAGGRNNQRAGRGGQGNLDRQGAGAGGRQGPGQFQATGDLVNINTATRMELLALPLVNDFLADGIISGRPWESLEDLIQLQGFGPMKLRRLQPMATAGPIRENTEETASVNPVD
ncbi:MAG: helix-hairpin-helix domain-containing protein [Verrucomicrobia bacterium]|nr:helix-hairpin-helix domain-containing protein [Verrucomicrobiota bacterium]